MARALDKARKLICGIVADLNIRTYTEQVATGKRTLKVMP
jgi:hypothetical protein